ncbi:MAG: 3-hydroxyacyl-CoA dehydrogenase [Gammaproteobacteria bacterium]|nr:3-hydroxyacyl-CoA dehydrogenase [Gammaproteobacteria bacterium]
MKPVSAADYTIAVVGAGAMGQGIAQVAVQGGVTTLLFDTRPGGAAEAAAQIGKRIDRLVEKGRIGEEDATSAKSRLQSADEIGALAACDAVIEAVFESYEVKAEVFQQIEDIVSKDCIIASNTSSIPIASIARNCKQRDRVAGMHFFNPVPLMKLVEVIRAAETSEATVAALVELGKRMTRVPVTVADMPGFLVNMGGRAFTTEALRIAHEDVARPEQIDAVMKECRHFRMGPFELMDLTGIDINFPASGIIYDGYMQDPRIKTAPNHEAMFNSGQFGRKTGSGWYRYADGKMVDAPSADHLSDAAPATRVALAEADDALASLCQQLGITIGDDDGRCPILAAPFGDDATHTAVRTGADHRRLVCVDLSCDPSRRLTIMTAPGADPASRDAVAAAMVAAGRAVTAIKDSPGFIAQRMAAMIANLGCYMAEVALATPEDIDLAMKLGLNYPHGPLELAADLGPQRCLRILERLQAITGEDRYRPTQWLKRRALLGLPIHTPS